MAGMFDSWAQIGIWQSETEELNQDIRDLDLAEGRLFATSGAGGGVLALELTTPGHVLDAQFHAGASSLLRGDSALWGDQLLSAGAPLRGLERRDLAADGTLGQVETFAGQLPTGARLLSSGAEALAVLDSAGGLHLWQRTAEGGLKQGGSLAAGLGGVSDLVVAGDLLLLADGASGGVLSYRGGAAGLQRAGQLGAAEGLAVTAPTALVSCSAHGQDWVVLAAQGTGSLSLMRLGGDGALTLTDHLTDTLSSRFGSATALATVAHGDRQFLVAGGGDGGLALLEILPGGRLLHLGDPVLPAGSGAVAALAVQIAGGQLQVYVASHGSAGVMGLALDLSTLAPQASATGTEGDDLLLGARVLVGGAGDDILVAQSGADLRGGAGRDRFVIGDEAGQEMILIRDFQIGVDQLDLSGLSSLRSAAALNSGGHKAGIRLYAGELEVIVLSHDHSRLTLADVFPSGIRGPHRWGLGETWDDGTRYGGAADDRVQARPSGERIDGQGGNDSLTGGAGADSLLGGDGTDSLIGGVGHDQLFGGRDADLLWGGEGADSLWGGLAHDALRGGAGADSLAGGAGDDRLWGEGDADILTGGLGDDLLNGGSGNDVLQGGAGLDRLIGGSGDDRLSDRSGAAWIKGGGGHDKIRAGAAADQLWGGAGRDVIRAGAGDDRLTGNSGDDRLVGGEGADLLSGGGGKDKIKGGSGADRLLGGKQDDLLWGGKGADVFVFTRRSGADVIRDFDPGLDHIDLSGRRLSWSKLEIDRDRGGSLLDLGRDEIWLKGVKPGDLTADDFIF